MQLIGSALAMSGQIRSNGCRGIGHLHRSGKCRAAPCLSTNKSGLHAASFCSARSSIRKGAKKNVTRAFLPAIGVMLQSWPLNMINGAFSKASNFPES